MCHASCKLRRERSPLTQPFQPELSVVSAAVEKIQLIKKTKQKISISLQYVTAAIFEFLHYK